MQKRLPDVGMVAFDQDDVEILAPVIGAKLPDELKSACPAAHHHDLRLEILGCRPF